MTDIIELPPLPPDLPPEPPPTLFYVDQDGNYLGGFSGAEPPEGAIEVPSAPADARQKWLDGVWLPVVEPEPEQLPVVEEETP